MKTFKQFKSEIKLDNTPFDRHKKISNEDKKQIRKYYENNIKLSEIAEMYNVSTSAIRYHLNPLSRLENAKRKYEEYHRNSADKNREIARRKRESREKYIKELYEAYSNNI